MKRIVALILISLSIVACTATEKTTAKKNGVEKTREAASKTTTSPDRDARGNYLK